MEQKGALEEKLNKEKAYHASRHICTEAGQVVQALTDLSTRLDAETEVAAMYSLHAEQYRDEAALFVHRTEAEAAANKSQKAIEACRDVRTRVHKQRVAMRKAHVKIDDLTIQQAALTQLGAVPAESISALQDAIKAAEDAQVSMYKAEQQCEACLAATTKAFELISEQVQQLELRTDEEAVRKKRVAEQVRARIEDASSSGVMLAKRATAEAKVAEGRRLEIQEQTKVVQAAESMESAAGVGHNVQVNAKLSEEAHDNVDKLLAQMKQQKRQLDENMAQAQQLDLDEATTERIRDAQQKLESVIANLQISQATSDSPARQQRRKSVQDEASAAALAIEKLRDHQAAKEAAQTKEKKQQLHNKTSDAAGRAEVLAVEAQVKRSDGTEKLEQISKKADMLKHVNKRQSYGMADEDDRKLAHQAVEFAIENVQALEVISGDVEKLLLEVRILSEQVHISQVSSEGASAEEVTAVTDCEKKMAAATAVVEQSLEVLQGAITKGRELVHGMQSADEEGKQQLVNQQLQDVHDTASLMALAQVINRPKQPCCGV